MENEKITMLRYRGSRFNKLKKLDLFPKVEENYKDPTPVGGTFSIFCFVIIAFLIYSEVKYYLDSKFVFKYTPDIDYDERMKINIDITVAMPCAFIGADILDNTNQNTFRFGVLDEEDTWFELSPNQRISFENKMSFNSYLRQEYHAVKDLLWKKSYSSFFKELPPREVKPNKPYDACRIYGSLELNKVAGNFHITGGKSLHLPRGHIHISAFMGANAYNFSHRIDKFSFGDPSPGIVHPLEGDEIITTEETTVYNYFVEVVPTKVKMFMKTIDTYQYSVKELARVIDHDKGSHGIPGIFFKYDTSSIKVIVSQERDNLGMFLARLCSIIGGVYVCSGIISNLVQLVYIFILCNWIYPKIEEGNIHVSPKVQSQTTDEVPLVQLT